MNFIDEQNCVLFFLELAKQQFETLFKIATIFSAREQCAQIERINSAFGDHIWHVVINDALGQPLCNGGFTNTRFANQKRVIFAPPR